MSGASKSHSSAETFVYLYMRRQETVAQAA